MTNEEFDNQFDVLYNSITSNQAPGLDTYEKSVFLTKAQEEILLSYFLPQSNKAMQGFDGSAIRQIDFSSVTKVWEENDFGDPANYDPRPNSRSTELPTDILVIVNERVTVERGKGDPAPRANLTVVPLIYEEYNRLMSKPYKRPLKWQAWRILNNYQGHNEVDIVIGPADTIVNYHIRYIKRPRPIIVGPLDGLTINGTEFDASMDCELDPIIHNEILQRAVELAKAAYTGDLNSQLALGQQSQTQIGQVATSR